MRVPGTIENHLAFTLHFYKRPDHLFPTPTSDREVRIISSEPKGSSDDQKPDLYAELSAFILLLPQAQTSPPSLLYSAILQPS